MSCSTNLSNMSCKICYPLQLVIDRAQTARETLSSLGLQNITGDLNPFQTTEIHCNEFYPNSTVDTLSVNFSSSAQMAALLLESWYFFLGKVWQTCNASGNACWSCVIVKQVFFFTKFLQYVPMSYFTLGAPLLPLCMVFEKYLPYRLHQIQCPNSQISGLIHVSELPSALQRKETSSWFIGLSIWTFLVLMIK